MGKIRIKERTSITETFRMSNDNETDRKYDITGEATVTNGCFTSLNTITATVDGRTLFNGNLMGTGINGTFHGDAEHPNAEIMAEVEAFVNDVKSYNFNANETNE